MSIYGTNDTKFDEVRALGLPLGRYAITSSGPLGIRDIRQIGDIDLVVDKDLWDILSARFKTITEQEITKIRIGNHIEIFRDGSFPITIPGAPTIADQIAGAEVLEGLSFVSLDHILWFKERMNRDKDKSDIAVLMRLLGREEQ